MSDAAAGASRRSTIPADWHHPNGGVPTGKGVVVAVIDSGWDRSSSNPRVARGVGFVNPDDDLSLRPTEDDHDRLGHGTACANLILDVAPDVEIVPVRVFGHRLETSPAVVEAAMDWAMFSIFSARGMPSATSTW